MKINNKLGILVFSILIFSVLNVGISNAATSSDGSVQPQALTDRPVFRDVQPAMVSMYGYPVGTEVNITYWVPLTYTPELMGSGNGLSWATGLSMAKNWANTTVEIWSVNITIVSSGEFKARNVDGSNGWSLEETSSNHPLLAAGELGLPSVSDVIGGDLLGESSNFGRWFVPETTTVTIFASILNANTSAELYLVGDMTAWDHTDRTYTMTLNDTVIPEVGTNITSWKVDFVMPATTQNFKIGAWGDESLIATAGDAEPSPWIYSEPGLGAHVLTPFDVQVSKPTFLKVDGATETQARDEANNKAAKFRTAIGENLTIWYYIYSLDDCAATSCQDGFDALISLGSLELQGDDAGKSLDWDVNDKLAFTYNNTLLKQNLTSVANITDGAYIDQMDVHNVSVAYFSINYTVQVEATQFKANFAGDWEGVDFSANNLLLAGIDWSSSVVGDVFNVGTFTLGFSATFADPNEVNKDIVGYGIHNGADWMEVNVTTAIPAIQSNGDWNFEVQLNSIDLGLVAGVEGEAQLILYHYDKGLSIYVKQWDPTGKHLFTPKDGVPTMTVSGDADQDGEVSLDWTADPKDSTVASVSFDWDDGSAASSETVGLTGSASHTYTADGEYNISATVTTAAGGETVVYVVVKSDATDPTATLTGPATSTELTVVFTFTATDTGSGVESVVLDFGDGTTTDVTPTNSNTHAYSASGTYTVTLTVTDAAGNTATATVTVVVDAGEATTDDTDDGFLPGFMFWGSMLSLIAVVTIIKRKR